MTKEPQILIGFDRETGLPAALVTRPPNLKSEQSWYLEEVSGTRIWHKLDPGPFMTLEELFNWADRMSIDLRVPTGFHVTRIEELGGEA